MSSPGHDGVMSELAHQVFSVLLFPPLPLPLSLSLADKGSLLYRSAGVLKKLQLPEHTTY
jgi:hypothetical protein